MIARCHWSIRTSATPWQAAEQSRLGRRDLKRLLVATGHVTEVSAVTIRPRVGQRRRRPWAFSSNARPLRMYLSVAHLDTAIAVAASPCRVGIDVVDLSSALSHTFAQSWFSEHERQCLVAVPIQLGWAAKEAAYKSLCRRERFVPKQWEISSIQMGGCTTADGVMIVQERSEGAPSRRAAWVVFHRHEQFAVAIATVCSSDDARVAAVSDEASVIHAHQKFVRHRQESPAP